MLWNIFNTFQLIIGTELLAILMPANIVFCFEMLVDIVNFQLLPKEDLYDTLIANPFDLDTYEERQKRSEDSRIKKAAADGEGGGEPSSLGDSFSGTDAIMNILFIVVALIFIGLLIGVVYLIRHYLLKYCCRPGARIILSFERKLMFNTVLRGLLESYFLLSVQMWYAWRSIHVEHTSQSVINFITVLLMTAYCFAFPLFSHNFLFKRRKDMKDEEF